MSTTSSSLNPKREAEAVDKVATEQDTAIVREALKQYEPDNVYNYDNTGLLWKTAQFHAPPGPKKAEPDSVCTSA